jgi:hypothetical protein
VSVGKGLGVKDGVWEGTFVFVGLGVGVSAGAWVEAGLLVFVGFSSEAPGVADAVAVGGSPPGSKGEMIEQDNVSKIMQAIKMMDVFLCMSIPH